MAQATKQDTSSTTLSPFGDLTKMLDQFKMPGTDMSAFIDARRQDVEAMVEANTTAFQAMQALARTQTDMLTQAFQGMQESAKGIIGGAAMSDPVKHAEVAGKAWQKMLTDMQGLAEMAQKTQADALAALTARASSQMEAATHVARSK